MLTSCFMPRQRPLRLASLAMGSALAGLLAVAGAPASASAGPYGIDIDPSNAVLVSTAGSDSTGTGTLRNPFRTIGKGAQVAAALGQNVYVAAGSYSESVSAISGVGIFGGFDPSTWTHSGGVTTIQAPPGAEQTLLAQAATNVVLASLTVKGPTGLAGAATQSNSFALRAVNRSTVALLGVTLLGGAAGTGSDGSMPGSAPQQGQPGAAGSSVTRDHCQSPPGGGGGGSGFAGSQGGAGGGGGGFSAGNPLAGATGGTGGPGTTGGPGGPGGPAQDGGNPIPDTDGKTGNQGANGSAGLNGPGGADAGNHSPDGTDWLGAAGGGGTTGSPGRGGGGGGGAGARRRSSFPTDLRIAGSSGGGGGGGGQGGGGGTAGQAGGASFGVYLHNSAVVADDSTVGAFAGGKGGHGGNGQPGAPGGNPGDGGPSVDPNCDLGSASGGAGGRGGDGGKGGGGGGGAGGPSAAMYDGAGSHFALRNTSMASGQPGQPGAGGLGAQDVAAPSGVPGKSGQTMNGGTSDATLDFDHDGVVDLNDQCPTVQGEPTTGCPGSAPPAPGIGSPRGDQDGDGVPDDLDRCPTVPRGAFDADGDGCVGPYGTIHALLGGFWDARTKSLLVGGLYVEPVPRGGKLEVICGTRRCKYAQTIRSTKGGRIRLTKLKDRVLRRGERFLVRVTAPGLIGQLHTLTVRRYPLTKTGRRRANRNPFKSNVACLPAGSLVPAPTCSARPPRGP
jgi:hypothetical protein